MNKSIVQEKEAIFISSSQDSDERDKSSSKRSALNEEGMAKAMPDEEDRSGEVVAGRIPDKLMKMAEKEAIFTSSSQDLDERDKSRSKRSALNEEGMAKAMPDEEDRSGKVAAGPIPDKLMKMAEKDKADSIIWDIPLPMEKPLRSFYRNFNPIGASCESY